MNANKGDLKFENYMLVTISKNKKNLNNLTFY